METLHTADELRRDWDDPEPLAGGAVLVTGDRIGAVGPYDELTVRFPTARVRSWRGVLGPARVHEGPLPAAPSPRERIHAVLKLGAVAVLAEYAGEPGIRAAAARAGVMVLPAAYRPAITGTVRADLAVFDADGRCLATVCAGRLVHRRA
ncbi:MULTISPECIES: imidazolonepropionase-like domain-containing protein [unclassified Streptomyces]|uniref:imidazolonepropionase-like domain-containing protein n=1 Tax=unclassified Streptomyces TaxID=2593676 RepID=UPI00380CACD4